MREYSRTTNTSTIGVSSVAWTNFIIGISRPRVTRNVHLTIYKNIRAKYLHYVIAMVVHAGWRALIVTTRISVRRSQIAFIPSVNSWRGILRDIRDKYVLTWSQICVLVWRLWLIWHQDHDGKDTCTFHPLCTHFKWTSKKSGRCVLKHNGYFTPLSVVRLHHLKCSFLKPSFLWWIGLLSAAQILWSIIRDIERNSLNEVGRQMISWNINRTEAKKGGWFGTLVER